MDLMLVNDLVEFMRGRGYVLDFSDTTFTEFFASELDVDIEDPTYAQNGGSKGRRPRSFLQQVDNATVTRTLGASDADTSPDGLG